MDFGDFKIEPFVEPAPGAEPVEPAAEPVEPVEPAEPVEPVEPTEPVEPVNEGLNFNWGDDREPVPAEPVEPAEPGAEPVEPVLEPGAEPAEPVVETFSKEDVEAMKAKWAEENSPTETTFANEQAKKINDLIAEGVELNEEFFRYQSLDFDSLDTTNVDDAIGILKESYKLKGYNEEQANRKINKNYAGLFDFEAEYASEEDKDAYRDAVIDISIEAKDEIATLKAHQKNLMLPKNAPSGPSAEDIERQRNAESSYKEQASNFLKTDFDKFDLKISDDVSLTVEVKDGDMRYVEELVTNPQKQATYFTDRYLKQDGSVNLEKFAREQYILENFDAIQKGLVNQAIAIGKEKVVKDGMSSLEPNLVSRGRAAAPKTKSFAQQMNALL